MDFNIELIGNEKIIMSDPDGAHPYFAWPTVVKLQNGGVAVGASGFRVEHICPFGKAVIAFSEDEGKNYTAPQIVIDTVLDDRDTGLTVFGENGLIVTSFTKDIETLREKMPQTQECIDYINSVSADDENAAKGVNFRISTDCGRTFGKLCKSPVSSPHGPAVLNDGSVLWVGRILGIHNHIEAHIIDTENGEMTLRGDMKLYEYEEFRDTYFYEPHAIQLPDGKIICHLRAENKDKTLFTLFQTESTDNGVSWSKPRQILRDDSGAPSHLFRHSSGILIAAFSHREMPFGIHVILSADGGKNWSEEYAVYENHYTDDLGYPATAELDDGSLLTVFYAKDNEESPAVIRQQKWKIRKN